MTGKWAQEGTVLAELIDQKFEERSEFIRKMELAGAKINPDILTNLVSGRTRLKGDRKRAALEVLQLSELPYRAPEARASHANETRRAYPDRTNLGAKVPAARAGCRNIPIYGSVPAGPPERSFSSAIEWYEMADWGDNFERWGRVVAGDSMEPEFERGDLAIFESRSAEDNQVVYATCDGQDVMKLLRRVNGRGEFHSLNPAYESFSADDWQIHGVCIRRVRDLGDGVEEIRKYNRGYLPRRQLG